MEAFKLYIYEKYSYDLDELQSVTREIAELYIGLGANRNIQIDSFIYIENGKMKCYPLVEVNYRKTMGLVVQSLADRYPEAKNVEWRIISAKQYRKSPLGDHWTRYINRSILLLS